MAWNAEYLENEILPATDITQDWPKLIDYDADSVVKNFGRAHARSSERESAFQRV